LNYLYLFPVSIPVSNPKQVLTNGGNSHGSETRGNAMDAPENPGTIRYETCCEEGTQLRPQYRRPVRPGSYYSRWIQRRNRLRSSHALQHSVYFVGIMNPPFLDCDYVGRMMLESDGDAARMGGRTTEEFWQ
jgi:hypothetical protein